MSLSPDAQALFDEAREASERPDAGVPDDARTRMRANVLAAAAAGGATAAATAAKAATATATAGKAAKTAGAAATATKAAVGVGTLSAGKAVLGFVAAAGITFGGLIVIDQQQAPESPPAATQSAAKTLAGNETATPEPVVDPAATANPVDEPVKEVDEPDAPTTRDETRTISPGTAVPAETLEEQAALLMRARDAIRKGRHAEAQRHLDSYQQRFGEGALGEEREALSVLNLCGRGDARGPDAAKRFATRHPSSPLLQRVEQSCR